MPTRVRKRRTGEKGKRFKIVEVRGGKVKGQSDSKRKAVSSSRVRNIVDREKRK